ncbi:MAG: hypothetical protein AB2660_16660, partial [Candidatus Thiodiazotropha sp.]
VLVSLLIVGGDVNDVVVAVLTAQFMVTTVFNGCVGYGGGNIEVDILIVAEKDQNIVIVVLR